MAVGPPNGRPKIVPDVPDKAPLSTRPAGINGSSGLPKRLAGLIGAYYWGGDFREDALA